jgi:hypothetical protein
MFKQQRSSSGGGGHGRTMVQQQQQQQQTIVKIRQNAPDADDHRTGKINSLAYLTVW